jgi:hypothetical protein
VALGSTVTFQWAGARQADSLRAGNQRPRDRDRAWARRRTRPSSAGRSRAGSPVSRYTKLGDSRTSSGAFRPAAAPRPTPITDNAHGGDPLAQLERNRGADTPQITSDLPVDENTDLVTISVGGNDLGFVNVLGFCANYFYCTKAQYTTACGGKKTTLALYLRCKRDELSPKLDDIYARIHHNAPGARILVLGYPQLFPALKEEQDCGKLNLLFSNTKQNYLRKAIAEANQLIAARAATSGVAEFVPVDGYFEGHEICANSGEVDQRRELLSNVVDEMA